MTIILSNTDMYYTCVMYCHEKHRVRLYRKTISTVSSPDGLLCFYALLGWFHFLQKIHFLCFKWPGISDRNTSLLQSLWLFQCDKIFLHRELFPSCFMTSWWVEVGWEGGSADGGERHGRNPRLKLMCWHHFVLLHRFLFPFSSRFAIRMKMGAEDLFCLCLSFLVVSCLVLSGLVLFCIVLTCLTSCCVLSCCLNLIPSLNLCLNLNSNLTRNLYLNLNLNVHLLLNLNLNPCQRYWKHNWTHSPYASSSQR